MKKGMKLFVWEGEGVLSEYTDGMICVLAHDLEEALRLIEEKCDYSMDSFPHESFKIVETPEAFICWGGG